MNFLLSCKNLAALTVLIGSVSSLLTPEKLEISAAFPTNNQFGIVFNGQPNKILLKVLNLGKDPVEDVMRIHQVWNEFREIGGKERLLRKGAPVPSKRTLPPKIEPYIIPYMFSAEEREGNIGLRIWVEWSGPKGKKHQSIAYDSTVTIQEPPTRWFDPQLILLYIILASTFGGIGYMVYSSYVVPVKPARSLKSKRSAEGSLQSSSKVSTPTGGAYEEEWIPAGHSVRSSKKTGTETGGEESSGAEGKARRRKR
ncbi:hypothetical protein PGT21_025567 [Puccinia graminis f. sp. tritici]|uniref:Translocon-associated protein subunit alpha n=2 Tax=Puccinia graminis f. sp. tritici TaxID=56615 RepID=E3KTL1_PUCGT|nr:uncharacterized protein PGTG_13504 [Puccinia graminis f. sp. tritici CRL 75-36-700-3]EFP87718.1 hypothetical protein PGTG_13504 [Puccinia graminis f. sp. tritici CRL 75-36-700-3]KAA1101599.1 hypothetical protein PGT21_025567 [Puccinia graminis f. sp. tritici]